MYKNRNIILLSFATSDLKRSIKRFSLQAQNSNYYDQIKIITQKKLSDHNKEKIDKLLSQGKNRGYCYWYWKPLLLLETFNQVKDGDIIHYLDIGFHINKNSYNYFHNYLDFLIKSDKSLLAFQYFPLKNKNSDGINFPKREEFKYTKADLFDYFGKLDDIEITHSPQFSAGNIFIKKDKKIEKFLLNWIEVFEKRFDLIDDTSSKLKNFEKFIENRHDQSVFSILCKINLIKPLSAYEFDWAEKDQKRTWEHIIDYPFLAKRDLRYGIFKRFLRRQARTFRRIKKKFVT
tara:strand:+ start:3748 stop:4617 length:870 start_codon:yes stop_codon:yes gene_type:complete